MRATEPSPPPSAPDQHDLRQRMNELLRHMPAGLVVHDAHGRILAANPLACRWLGADESQLRARETDLAAWRLLRDDGSVLPAHEFPVSRVLADAAPLSDMVIGLPGEEPGQERWLLANAYPELGRDGRVERVIVCFTDCTELKRTEARLRKSEERLGLALKGSNDGAWDWDLVTGEMYCSERWWGILGYPPSEAGTDGAAWHSFVHPDDQDGMTAFIDTLLAGRCQTYSVEFRLVHRDGHPVPVLSRGYVLRDASGKAVRLSGTNTDLTERKRAERRIHELAYYDPLTGLPNRRFLIEHLARLLAPGAPGGGCGAVLFIDLDDFKSLNDTLGHATGDRLLQEVARRLCALVGADWPQPPCVARLGGDEFVVVLDAPQPDPGPTAAAARALAGRLLAELGRPYQLGGHRVHSTPSIGIALFDADTGSTEAVLMQADLAMYRAKAEGRNTVRLFAPGMQAEAERRAALEAGLRRAIERREFVLHYQPQFDRAGNLVGAEALVRWRQPDGSLTMPGEFIALAEDTGMILPLGNQIVELACSTLARWAAMRSLAHLKLAVNVSVHQLRDPGFQQTVAANLAGRDGARLQLEITESVFAGDLPAIAQRMHALRALGVVFALDDFGTGYSALAYLKRLPLSTLKIDRAFVHDLDVDAGVAPQGAPIVEAIIGLAHKLGLDVVAEGVETPAQHDFLARSMCDAMQGYLLGRPQPIEEFERRFAAPGP